MSRLRIAITGPDGSGKSTVCARVREALDSRFGRGSCAEVSIWDLLGDSRIKPPFSSKEEAARYLGDLDGSSRTLFLFHAMSRALQLAERTPAKILLLNGYWYKYAVSELGYGVPTHTVEGAARGFAKPDQTFFLEVTPHTAAARRSESTRYESGLEQNDFVAFQTRLALHWGQIEEANGPWEHVSTQPTADAVAAEITQRILHLAGAR
jgi:thymidylate kinase